MSRSDSGVPVAGGPEPRRFPWRLWLYAILMTGAAGAGGYFAWQYRSAGTSAASELSSCAKNLGALQTSTGNVSTDLKSCTDQLGAVTLKSTQLEKAATDTGKNLSATQEELTALRAQKAEADKRSAAIEDIRTQFAKMIDTGQLRVSARRGQLVLSLPSEVLFTTGSADLSKPGEYAVVEVAAVLKKLPHRRFLVVGHTDTQDFVKPKDAGGGSASVACAPQDNWQLSTARSLTVTRVLVTAGMNAKNLVPSGVGANDPIADNATPAGRQKNRRIEIALLPALEELPPLPANLAEETAPAAPTTPTK
jgi:chemotaxis protein MotB